MPPAKLPIPPKRPPAAPPTAPRADSIPEPPVSNGNAALMTPPPTAPPICLLRAFVFAAATFCAAAASFWTALAALSESFA